MKQRYTLTYSEMIGAIREFLLKQGIYTVGEAGSAELFVNNQTNEFIFDFYPEQE